MDNFFLQVVNASISAGWIVLAVLLVRLVFKKAPKWMMVLLWGVVALRLVLPFSIESKVSLMPSAQTFNPGIMLEQTPVINSGIPVIDDAVNPGFSEAFTPDVGDSANPLQIWIPILAAVWALGVVAMIGYSIFSCLRVRKMVGQAVRLRDNIFQSETVVTPFVFGIFRPRIYLPFSIDAQDMEYVVAHEQAHIRRKDHLWKPLGFLLLTLHWFNPLVWVGYVLLCKDIELACDEKVIKEYTPHQKADYSQALLSCSAHRRIIAACPLAFGEVSVKDRVKAVLSYKKPAFWIIIAAVVATAVVAVCFLTNPLTEEEKPEEPKPPTMFRVKVDGKWGLMDNTGQYVIEPKYRQIGSYSSNGLTAVQMPDEKWGYVDQSGQMVIEPIFERCSSFDENGMAWVEIEGNFRDLMQEWGLEVGRRRWGCIDSTGQFVIQPQFIGERAYFGEDGWAAVWREDGWGFVDRSGNMVIQPQFDWAENFSKAGLAIVKVNGKYGVIDRTGAFVAEPQYEQAWQMGEGWIAVSLNNKRGCIDSTGKLVVEPQYDGAVGVSHGLVMVKVDGKWGFIDKSGQMVIEPKIERCHNYAFAANGLLAVKSVPDNKWGYIDTTGEFAIAPIFDMVYDFNEEGYAKVIVNGKSGLIDSAGQFVVQPLYDDVGQFYQCELAKVRLNGKYGFINRQGQVVIDFLFEDATDFSHEGLAGVKVNGKWGFIDTAGRFVMEPQLDSVYNDRYWAVG